MHPASLALRNSNRDAAILFRVKSEVHQQVAAGLPHLMQSAGGAAAAAAAAVAAQRMVCFSNARINGVKPEVIGGPLGNLRPVGVGGGNGSGSVQCPSPHPSSSSSSSQLSPQTPSQTPPRGTPTVIMGESCGVRTMVWGYEPPPPSAGQSHGQHPQQQQQSPHHQPQQQQQQQQQQSQQQQQQQQQQSLGQQQHCLSSPSAGSLTPSSSSGGGSVSGGGVGGPLTPSSVAPQNNEEAAQLLLSLGQTRIQDMRSRPHPFRTPHALNMERLWAGDYSQLPPGQLQALNLSAQQQQWGSSNSTGLGGVGGGMGGRNLEAPHEPTDEDEQPLVCMICEDKATGLHYGIITCEG